MSPVKINMFWFCIRALVFSFLPFFSAAQSVSVRSTIDRDNILIGEPIVVKVKAGFPAGSSFSGIQVIMPDSIPHFEFVESSKADSITYKDDSRAIEQQFIFTSFDSGKWSLPAFDVRLSNLSGSDQKLSTDSFSIAVNYSPADSTNELRDIKPIMDVHIVDYTWWYIAGGLILLLLITWLLWRYFKNRKKDPAASKSSSIPAYDEAMRELDKLSGTDLTDPILIRSFHTRCTEIFKRYLGRTRGQNLDNRTTSDLLVKLSGREMDADSISRLAIALRCSDAVKFAKYRPSTTESEECKQIIRETITGIEKQMNSTRP